MTLAGNLVLKEGQNLGAAGARSLFDSTAFVSSHDRRCVSSCLAYRVLREVFEYPNQLCHKLTTSRRVLRSRLSMNVQQHKNAGLCSSVIESADWSSKNGRNLNLDDPDRRFDRHLFRIDKLGVVVRSCQERLVQAETLVGNAQLERGKRRIVNVCGSDIRKSGCSHGLEASDML